MTTAERIKDEALSLTEEERAELAEALFESLNPTDGEPENMAEILAERAAASREGQLKYHDPLEIFSVYERLKKERHADSAS